MIKTKKINPQPAPRETFSESASAILDIAEQLAQTRGYNGFSYADIAVALGVTKASLHYHFPSKAELGRALIARYQANFAAELAAINQTAAAPPTRLRRYVALYEAVMRQQRMCLCGMLAAEFATLPAPMQDGLMQFFDLNERWLAGVLQQGRLSGSFVFKESAGERARVILGALEGAMLVARSYGDYRRFQVAAKYVLADCSALKEMRSKESVSCARQDTRAKAGTAV